MNAAWILGFVGILLFFVDVPVVLFFQSIHPSPLDWFFLFITQKWVLIAVLIFSSVVVARRSIAPFWLACGATVLISRLLKWAIMRPRPYDALDFLPLVAETSFSFPSNHAAVAFAALPFVKNKYYFAFAGIVAFSRVYIGVHYPTDVIFGGLFGYLIGMAIEQMAIEKRWQKWFPRWK